MVTAATAAKRKTEHQITTHTHTHTHTVLNLCVSTHQALLCFNFTHFKGSKLMTKFPKHCFFVANDLSVEELMTQRRKLNVMTFSPCFHGNDLLPSNLCDVLQPRVFQSESSFGFLEVRYLLLERSFYFGREAC